MLNNPQNEVITNDVSDSYQYIYVIAHIICNHTLYVLKSVDLGKRWKQKLVWEQLSLNRC
jgi:hypothetical protein